MAASTLIMDCVQKLCNCFESLHYKRDESYLKLFILILNCDRTFSAIFWNLLEIIFKERFCYCLELLLKFKGKIGLNPALSRQLDSLTSGGPFQTVLYYTSMIKLSSAAMILWTVPFIFFSKFTEQVFSAFWRFDLFSDLLDETTTNLQLEQCPFTIL